MLNVSFKKVHAHVSTIKRQSSVRQRRRHTDVSSLTVNLGAFSNREL